MGTVPHTWLTRASTAARLDNVESKMISTRECQQAGTRDDRTDCLFGPLEQLHQVGHEPTLVVWEGKNVSGVCRLAYDVSVKGGLHIPVRKL